MTNSTSKINVVLVTTAARSELLEQSINSICQNAELEKSIDLTVVMDGYEWATAPPQKLGLIHGVLMPQVDRLIISDDRVGASAARNIGASSIPLYRRGSHVCFFDDDIYACPGWDRTLLGLLRALPGALCSGHSHPYNHGDPGGDPDALLVPIPPHVKPLVISTVNFLMPWAMWDHVGMFEEPGGPGGSEDYAWCMRAKKLTYGFAVSDPQCVIHCGLTSSSGKQIVGFDEMKKQNEELIAMHKLKGVIWV